MKCNTRDIRAIYSLFCTCCPLTAIPFGRGVWSKFKSSPSPQGNPFKE